MLAEASKPELLVNAFDIDYAWPLMATLNKVFDEWRIRRRNSKRRGEETWRSFPRARCICGFPTIMMKLRAVARYWSAGRAGGIGADVYVGWRAADL